MTAPSSERRGLTERIRKELAKGPVTSRELAQRLKVPIGKVKSLLGQLKGGTGWALVYDRKPTRYVAREWLRPHPWTKDRPEPYTPPDDSLRIAKPITIGRGLAGWQ